MKTKRVLAIVGVLGLVMGLGFRPSLAATIDFEEFNLSAQMYLDVPDTLTCENVQGSGIDVTIIGGADLRIYDVFVFGFDPSAVGQALIDWPWPAGTNPEGTRILFSAPVSNFSLRAGDFGGDDDSPLTIMGLDTADQVIGFDSVPWNSSPPFAALNIEGPGISQVIYHSGGAYANSTFIDDITFVPEPATIGLLGLGLAGLAMRRRRRR